MSCLKRGLNSEITIQTNCFEIAIMCSTMSFHGYRLRRAKPHTHLIEVYDGESICLSFSHVSDTEVEPLSVLVGIKVKGQIELIIPLPSVQTNKQTNKQINEKQ